MNLINKTFLNITDRIKGDNLKARCVRSSIVLGIGAFLAKLMGFGSKMVLTRLLFSQEMGLMVMILSLTQLFEVLTEIGIKQSVIQNKNGAEPDYLNMAWWFQSLRAIGLYSVAFIVTPWLCGFYFQNKPEVLTHYAMDELIILVRVAFLCILFNGFISPNAHVLEKKFKFGRAVLINQGSLILGTVVTIILAFTMRNVWAIVIGFTGIGFFRCIISYVMCPFLPKFEYDRERFQELYRFARGVFGLPLLTYIAFNIDVLVAGKVVSTSLVGFYGMALVLAIAPHDLFSRIISPILFPAFAEKQDDKQAICGAVLQITKMIALFVIPSVVLVAACSKAILALVYGSQYSVVSIPFSLLCVYVLLLMQAGVLGGVFFGIGQPGKHRAFVGVRTLVLVIFIYPGIKFFGLTGAAGVVLMASIIAMCLQVTIMHRVIGLRIYNYLVSWLPGIVLSIPVFIIVKLLQWLKPDSPYLYLIVGFIWCVISCLVSLSMLKSFSKSEQPAGKSHIIEFSGHEKVKSAQE